MDTETKTKAFIIAGGKSSRFGEDKTLFEFEGKPLIEHVYDALKPVFDDISIVASNGEKFSYLGVPVYPDAIEGFGPTGAVYTALQHCTEGERAFVFPSDTPNLSSELIENMRDIAPLYDVVVPWFDGHYQPLHAIYSHSCLPHIQAMIDREERQLIAFYKDVELRIVNDEEILYYDDPQLIFRNVNYKEDL